MKIIYKKILIFILILTILFNISINISKAETYDPSVLQIGFNKDTFLDPDFLTLEIFGNSATTSINLADIKIKFDKNNLVFESIDFTDGFCELFIYNYLNTANDTINFACATTKATSTLNFAKIKFKKINSGWTSIDLSDSKYFSNNGLGEVILPDTENHSFYIYK